MSITLNGTTGISSVDGSSASPSVRGSDSNSGIVYGADTVKISTGGTERLEVDSSGNVDIPDNGKIRLGGAGDLSLYHDGSNSYIKDTGTGVLKIESNQLQIKNDAADEKMLVADANGAVELYFNGSKKFETKNDGVIISQEVTIANAVNTYPWTVTGDVDNGVLLNSLTTNVKFPISANSNDTIACILNRTNGNGTIIEFKYQGNVVGSISSNGNSLPSDRDFKTNISDLNLGLSLVNKLKPSQFNYKIDDANTPVMYGLIAQEFEEAITSEGITKNSTQLIQHHPTDDTESNYSVDYSKLIPILINSIKELSVEVDTLKTKVAALEAA